MGTHTHTYTCMHIHTHSLSPTVPEKYVRKLHHTFYDSLKNSTFIVNAGLNLSFFCLNKKQQQITLVFFFVLVHIVRVLMHMDTHAHTLFLTHMCIHTHKSMHSCELKASGHNCLSQQAMLLQFKSKIIQLWLEV